jgi:hypothetical protein
MTVPAGGTLQLPVLSGLLFWHRIKFLFEEKPSRRGAQRGRPGDAGRRQGGDWSFPKASRSITGFFLSGILRIYDGFVILLPALGLVNGRTVPPDNPGKEEALGFVPHPKLRAAVIVRTRMGRKRAAGEKTAKTVGQREVTRARTIWG